MSVKLALLKSGEDVIADIQEMLIGDAENPKVIGYFFDRACAVRVKLNEEEKYQISLVPWVPLSKDSKIPLPSDWVITIVEPIDSLKEMYENQVLKNGKNSKIDGVDEQSNSDISD